MTRILLEIDDDANLASTLDTLAALSSVCRVIRLPDADGTTPTVDGSATNASDFFSLAGLWHTRDITIEDIRAAAWPER